MGWIEKVKSIIYGLKASGKSEKEIEQIVKQASDKAMVKGTRPPDEVDAIVYAVVAQGRYKARTESNNWKKMHGLPMRRKWRTGK